MKLRQRKVLQNLILNLQFNAIDFINVVKYLLVKNNYFLCCLDLTLIHFLLHISNTDKSSFGSEKVSESFANNKLLILVPCRYGMSFIVSEKLLSVACNWGMWGCGGGRRY